MIRTVTFLLSCLLILTSCTDEAENAQLRQLSQELDKTLTDAKSAIEKLTPSSEQVSEAAEKEIEKLHNVEYKVVEMPFTSTALLQEKLTELGNDRWQCFHIERKETTLLFFCSRRPKSYLRYIPRLF